MVPFIYFLNGFRIISSFKIPYERHKIFCLIDLKHLNLKHKIFKILFQKSKIFKSVNLQLLNNDAIC